MTPVPAFATHADYLATVPDGVRPRLEAILAEVAARLPAATPCISYSMPAYRGRRVFFYAAAFKKHIGVYPPLRHDAELIAELAPYRNEKGNLAFPLAEPLPLELIGRVAVSLHREIEER